MWFWFAFPGAKGVEPLGVLRGPCAYLLWRDVSSCLLPLSGVVCPSAVDWYPAVLPGEQAV